MKTMHTKGFTLIEVMVVLVIVAILASIAWSQYEDYTRKNIRGQAVHMLTLLRQEMERCASNNNGSYANCANTYANFVQPIINNQYRSIHYNINTQIPNPTTGTGYLLTATNIANLDAIPDNNDDDCNTLTIDDLGNKGFTELGLDNKPSNIIRCWGSS